MSYATAAELAAALRIPITANNTQYLTDCVDAASKEIDHEIDGPIVMPSPLAHLVCIIRGIEWYKANDASFGSIGFNDTGILATPRNQNTLAGLLPLKQQFGIT